MKGGGISLPLHVHNKVPLETCDLMCQWIKSVSHVVKKMSKMLSFSPMCYLLLRYICFT